MANRNEDTSAKAWNEITLVLLIVAACYLAWFASRPINAERIDNWRSADQHEMNGALRCSAKQIERGL